MSCSSSLYTVLGSTGSFPTTSLNQTHCGISTANGGANWMKGCCPSPWQFTTQPDGAVKDCYAVCSGPTIQNDFQSLIFHDNITKCLDAEALRLNFTVGDTKQGSGVYCNTNWDPNRYKTTQGTQGPTSGSSLGRSAGRGEVAGLALLVVMSVALLT